MNGDDEDSFAKGMKGVKPLRGRDKVRPPEPPPRSAPAPRDTQSANSEIEPFEIERLGERVRGRAPGIDRREQRRLERGDVEVDETVDLHGLDIEAALRALRETFDSALAEGHRCVLVVHGRGTHSRDAPVLKEAFLAWLAEPPVGPRVMAFASAVSRDGGPGATYVLLRRQR